jgi:hypothetical protein
LQIGELKLKAVKGSSTMWHSRMAYKTQVTGWRDSQTWSLFYLNNSFLWIIRSWEYAQIIRVLTLGNTVGIVAGREGKYLLLTGTWSSHSWAVRAWSSSRCIILVDILWCTNIGCRKIVRLLTWYIPPTRLIWRL